MCNVTANFYSPTIISSRLTTPLVAADVDERFRSQRCETKAFIGLLTRLILTLSHICLLVLLYAVLCARTGEQIEPLSGVNQINSHAHAAASTAGVFVLLSTSLLPALW